MKVNKSAWKAQVKLFPAQTISLFGSSIVQYAIIWYVTLTTASGLMMTISTACGFLPSGPHLRFCRRLGLTDIIVNG